MAGKSERNGTWSRRTPGKLLGSLQGGYVGVLIIRLHYTARLRMCVIVHNSTKIKKIFNHKNPWKKESGGRKWKGKHKGPHRRTLFLHQWEPTAWAGQTPKHSVHAAALQPQNSTGREEELDYRISGPRVQSWLRHLSAGRPWPRHLTSLKFFIYETVVGIIG